MGIDSITEITTQSWGSRLKNSIGGIFFGFILIVGSTVLLFWNEGRAVKRAQALEEGSSSVISVSSNEVDPANDNKLIHLSGNTATKDLLSDSIFPVSAEAIKLRRSSKMYQWDEEKKTKTKEKTGGKKETITTYSYNKTWSSSAISSSSFKQQSGHENPGSFPYPEQSHSATNVSLDAFALSPSQVSGLGGFQTLSLPAQFKEQLPDGMKARAHIEGETLYLGEDPSIPKIGDMKISFEWVEPGKTVSIVAQQQGSSFVPYVAKSGSSIQLLVHGEESAEAMFNAEKKSNTILTWLIRVGGFFLMFIGFRTMFNIARTLAAVLPFLARIVGFGLSLISGLFAMTITLLTIAIAWFTYRPLLSIVLIVVIAGIFILVKMKRKPTKQEAFVPPPPPG